MSDPSQQWRRRPGPPPWARSDRRPEWWPEGSSWPPRGPDDWRRHGTRIARRVGCAFAAALLVLGLAGTGLVWLLLSAFGVVGSAPFVRLVSAAGLLLGIAAVGLAIAALRRVTSRAGSLVDAARAIEAGDFSARVPVRGPSELRQLARAFNAMAGRLEAEAARRQSVIADVSHELRTPLTIIRGQAEAIADGVYPPGPDGVAPILAASHTLEVLIEDLRTLALAETGSLRLHREPVDVAELVNEATEAFRIAADEDGVAMVADVATTTPNVDADPVRLRGVLHNLIGNALRYTRRGGTIRVSAHAESEDVVVIAVSDDGAGIPAEMLGRIFDRFVKDETSPGSGLGLAIVRDVVEAHGGRVSAQSEPGRGTTVALRLPVARTLSE